METTEPTPPSERAHGIGFRTLALRDRIVAATLLLLAGAVALEGVALAGVFWSRARFGLDFNAADFDVFRRVKSDKSVDDTIKKAQAMEARAEMRRIKPDDASAMLVKRAASEREDSQVLEGEDRIVRTGQEREAEELMRSASAASDAGRPGEAVALLKLALAKAPDHMPAIRELALLFEQQQDYAQATFQWQKAATVAPPGSPDLGEIQGNLNRVARLAEADRTRREAQNGPAVALRWEVPSRSATPPPTPTGITIGDITRQDLPLEYRKRRDGPTFEADVRFKLQIPLNSRGTDPWVELRAVEVRIAFYDQFRNRSGKIETVRSVSDTVEPGRDPWPSGTQRLCSIIFHLDRNYLRSHRSKHGDSYQFAGYVVSVYYRGKLMDERAVPEQLLRMVSGDSDPRGGAS